jgi:hypothetical protein
MSSAPPDNRLRLAEQQVARYREDIEEWQREHNEVAQKSCPIEDVIINGTHYLHAIIRLDAALKSESMREQGGIEPSLGIRYALREWLVVSQRVLEQVERLERDYGHVEGASVLRSDIEMVQTRLDSTRPISIDALGRVFEITGERIILPGLSPDNVREAMEDEREGRVYPLER